MKTTAAAVLLTFLGFACAETQPRIEELAAPATVQTPPKRKVIVIETIEPEEPEKSEPIELAHVEREYDYSAQGFFDFTTQKSEVQETKDEWSQRLEKEVWEELEKFDSELDGIISTLKIHIPKSLEILKELQKLQVTARKITYSDQEVWRQIQDKRAELRQLHPFASIFGARDYKELSPLSLEQTLENMWSRWQELTVKCLRFDTREVKNAKPCSEIIEMELPGISILGGRFILQEVDSELRLTTREVVSWDDLTEKAQLSKLAMKVKYPFHFSLARLMSVQRKDHHATGAFLTVTLHEIAPCPSEEAPEAIYKNIKRLIRSGVDTLEFPEIKVSELKERLRSLRALCKTHK